MVKTVVPYDCSNVMSMAILVLLSVSAVSATVPIDLSNLHSRATCPQEVLIVRPSSLEDLEVAGKPLYGALSLTRVTSSPPLPLQVRSYGKVQANGAGCSWNKEMFCSTPGKSLEASLSTENLSVNVQTTTIRPLRIEVNEKLGTVKASAGVRVKDLLDYLANFVTPSAPSGWTLGAFPWYVYQTIGGAVATGTHGSSIYHNSLSHQVTELEVVLANGTQVVINDSSYPFLMKAFRVSVGRLGVITSATLRIVPEVPVKRSHTWIWPSQFLERMEELERHFNNSKALPDWADEIQFFWSVQSQEVSQVSFTRADEHDPLVRDEILSNLRPDESTAKIIRAVALELANRTDRSVTPIRPWSTDNQLVQIEAAPIMRSDGNEPSNLDSPMWNSTFIPAMMMNNTVRIDTSLLMDVLGNMDSNVFLQTTKLNQLSNAINAESLPENISGEKGSAGKTWKKVPPVPRQGFLATLGASFLYSSSVVAGLESVVGNSTREAASSYIHQPLASEESIRGTAYSQYEVAIPVSRISRCFKGLFEMVYNSGVDDRASTDGVDTGFRTANLIRIIGKEDGLLSLSNDEPRVYMNFEDYIGPNLEPGQGYNFKFQQVVEYLRGSQDCYGTRMHWGKSGFPMPGCFRGELEFPSTWCDFGCAVSKLDPTNKFDDMSNAWNWDGVDLARCCTDDGFNTQWSGCSCSPIPRSYQCPGSPYYDKQTSYNYWEI